MVNWWSNCINLKPMIKVKKKRQVGDEIEFLYWLNWIIFKVWSQSRLYMRSIRNQMTKIPFTKMTSFWLLFIFFFNFLSDNSGKLLCRCFTASNLHQIWQNLHVNAHLKFLNNLVWFVQADWQYKGRRVGLKWPTQTALNCQI